MALKINLKKNILVPGLETEAVTLPEDVHTLRDLLQYIGRLIHFEIIALDTGDLQDDFEVSINGREAAFVPEGLDISLKDNDYVDIEIVPLGGG